MKIIAVVDNKAWCWTTTAKDVAHILPQHDFEFVPAREYRPDMEADLVWVRGYERSIRHKPTCPWLWTMTTGGKRLAKRLAENRGSRFVICQCRMAYDEMSARGYTAWMVPNGVNTALFGLGDRQHSKKVVGFAGNITGERNQLKGYGVAEEGARLAQMTLATTTSEIPIPHAKMPDWYHRLFAYCQPSESEGCSNSVMEAMACGLPCLIVEGVGYHGEVCRDGIKHEDGEVVFVRRDDHHIASRLRLLAANPYLYERVSHNARAFAEVHGWRHIARKMNEVFEAVASMPAEDCEKKVTPAEAVAEEQAAEQSVFRQYIAIRSIKVEGKTYEAGQMIQDIPHSMVAGMLKSRLIREA